MMRGAKGIGMGELLAKRPSILIMSICSLYHIFYVGISDIACNEFTKRSTNQWCYSLINQAMTLVFYRLNSAIERGTKPDAVGRKPCHWTSTLKAAMVNARRAGKYAQPGCPTLCKWQTRDSISRTLS